MKKLNLPIEEIIKLYESGLGCYKIANQFNCSASSINNILKRNVIYTKKNPNDYRKYKLNQDYFNEINTEDKAYFLGLIYADGCVCKNTLSISLVESDSYILYKLLFFLQSEAKVYFLPSRNKNEQPQRRVAISNKKITEALFNLGVIERKSLILKLPNFDQVPIEFMHHFIRGHFDGDGSIFSYERIINGKNYIEAGISIISSVEFIRDLRELIGYGNVYHTNNNRNSFISFKNKKEIQAFSEFIYKDSTIYIERKHKKICQVLDYLGAKKHFYNGEKIAQMDLYSNVIKIWNNIDQIRNETDYNIQTILRNIKGKIKTSNNFKFVIYD